MKEKMTFGTYSFEVSNLEKVLFPDDGITKRDLIDYYRDIADTMLPHLDGRPLMMHRFPDGIGEEGFYQKEASDHFPDWIHLERVKTVKGRAVNHVVCDNAATLLYLVQEATITPHVWLSRIDRLRRPDKIIFDLDPTGDDFEPVRGAALALKEMLEEVELLPFVMTTGSRGLHVVVPVKRTVDFDQTRDFARNVARRMADRYPDEYTIEQYKSKRGNRLFLDTGRNAYGQTGVAPYALRARKGAPVATPLEWEELNDKDLGPRSYDIGSISRRLGQKEDPWSDIYTHARGLEGPSSRMGG